jgi:hypothetical protein
MHLYHDVACTQSTHVHAYNGDEMVLMELDGAA